MTVVTRIDFCKLSIACYRAYLEIVRAIEAALSCFVGWAMHSLVRVATQSLNRASRLRHRVTHTYVRAEIGVFHVSRFGGRTRTFNSTSPQSETNPIIT